MQGLSVSGLDARRHCEMLDLRVGEHLIDRVDRPARNAGRVEPLHPFETRLAGKIAVDLGIQGVAIGGAGSRSRVFGPLNQGGRVDSAAQPLPYFLTGRGDVDVPVSGLEHPSRNAGWVVVPSLSRHLALDEPARGL